MTSSDVSTKMGDTHFMLFHREYEKPEDSGDTIFSDKAIWVCLKMMDTPQMAFLKRQAMINALDLGTPARLDYERLPASPKNISSQTHMGDVTVSNYAGCFFFKLRIIIPTDELILFRGVGILPTSMD